MDGSTLSSLAAVSGATAVASGALFARGIRKRVLLLTVPSRSGGGAPAGAREGFREVKRRCGPIPSYLSSVRVKSCVWLMGWKGMGVCLCFVCVHDYVRDLKALLAFAATAILAVLSYYCFGCLGQGFRRACARRCTPPTPVKFVLLEMQVCPCAERPGLLQDCGFEKLTDGCSNRRVAEALTAVCPKTCNLCLATARRQYHLFFGSIPLVEQE